MNTGQEIICCKSISVVVKKKDVVILLLLFPNANIAANNYQLLDEVDQNIVICQWRADQ